MSNETNAVTDGVWWNPEGWWEAVVNSVVVGSGPDKRIVNAAYDFYAHVDEFRSGPSDDTADPWGVTP